MFSGIVERIGRVERVTRRAGGDATLRIHAGFAGSPAPGASVAVNGVCLTVERSEGPVFEATAVPETLKRTTIGELAAERRVNLERALRVGGEIGGHWVQGHVDAMARIASVRKSGADVIVGIEIPEELRAYVAPKGSLAVDGVSLTVASWSDPRAFVALVPYTLERTIASEYEPGRAVNLEIDVVARYLERLLEARGVLPEPRGAGAGGDS
ncbi:MAG: riboflavin synthase [Candidatus Latescibacteria bacterium]|nr:riboflavin synthase [Candidatus Latescibacterota bacterium]